MFGSFKNRSQQMFCVLGVSVSAALAAPAWAADCNNNGVDDSDELAAHTASDCNANGVLDSCDIAAGTDTDANANGFPDSCDAAAAAPAAVLASQTNATCGLANGAIDATVTDAPLISWSGPNGFSSTQIDLANLAAGAYTLTATGPGGIATLIVTIVATPDTVAPTASGFAASYTLAAAGVGCTAIVPSFSTGASLSDDCTATAQIAVSQTPAAGSALAVGTHAGSLRVQDASGNYRDYPIAITVTGSATSYYIDGDGDGFGSSTASAVNSCSAVANSVANRTDCNDSRATAYPGAPELCNSLDDDCDGAIDENIGTFRFYRDDDGDGFGDPGVSITNCTNVAPDGFVSNSGDCNDLEILFADLDGDGYGAGPFAGCGVTDNTDCDNSSNAAHPGAPELCATVGTDNDCDGNAAEVDANASDKRAFYLDSDGDGYGSAANASAPACTAPAGYASSSTDCDDGSASISPGVAEACDAANVDENCNGLADNADSGATGKTSWYADNDGDTYGGGSAISACDAVGTQVAAGGDCDDSSAAVHPGAAENCANIAVDNDCDGDTSAAEASDSSTFYRDQDLDGHSVNTTAKFCLASAPAGYLGALSSPVDCNDSSASVYPGAVENCANLAIDNDCDGSTAETEAVDRSTWYADADNDGSGDGSSSQLACSQPSGYVAVAGDACPSNGSLTAPITYYADADGDGAGSASAAQAFCSTTAPAGYVTNTNDGCPSDPAKTSPGTCGCGVADADSDGDGVKDCNDGCPSDPLKTAPGQCGCGYVDTDSDGDGTANCNDLCPNDPAKTAPGACGCGFADTDFNGNGVPDCSENSPVLSFTASDTTLRETDAFALRVSMSNSAEQLAGVQLALHFDPQRFAIVSVVPVAGGPFQTPLGETIDNTNGTLAYAVGVDPGASAGATSAASLFDINFAVLPAPTVCSSSALIFVGDVGSFTTSFISMAAVPITAIPAAMPALRVDSEEPVFAGLMANASVPTDAGSTYGGYVAQPAVTATDDCDNARTVSVSVAYAGGGTGSAWPANGLFPIGVSTVTWTATDTCGNTATASRTVTVENYQLLDIAVSLQAPLVNASSRSITVKAGAQTSVHTVNFSGASGTVSGIQVPVAAGYACMSARDAAHSITDAAAPAVSNRRYVASFLLKQGDSSNDDLIDIFDYAIFLADRSTAANAFRAFDARSNFNGDDRVNSVDFSYLSANFMQVGESCGAFTGGQPRDRVSVKELRRMGLGHLAGADLNRDGWIDLRDIQIFVQNGGNTPQDMNLPEPVSGSRW